MIQAKALAQATAQDEEVGGEEMIIKLELTLSGKGFFRGKSTILQICRKVLEDTGRYTAKEEHGGWMSEAHNQISHWLVIEEVEEI